MTVQGGGGGILQDGHGLDVGRVQVGDVAGVRHAIQHVERGGGAVDGSDTADADARVVTRRSVGAVYLDAGHRAFEGGGDGRGRAVGDLLGADRGDGARKGGPLGGAVGDRHDRLFQRFAVGVHRDVNLGLHRDFLRLHTDEGDDKRLGVRGDAAEVESTVDVGHGSHLGSLHEDGNTGEGLSVLILNGSLDGGNLCECGTCNDQETGQEKKESFHLHIN